MNKIEKLQEVNRTLHSMIVDLETRLFLEEENTKKRSKPKESTEYK